jgi:hypothetical protein
MPTTSARHRRQFEAYMSSRLNPDDQKRVEQYLSAPQHQVERQPFRVWRLLLVILITVIGLGVLSRLLSRLVL